MTHQYDLRLVAYTPYSDRMGVLLPMQFSWTHARYRYPVMQIDYLPDAVRFDWMETLPEIALEVWDGTDWVEPDDCRMVVESVERDRANPKMPVRYTYLGIGSVNGKVLIADETVQDPGDGPVRPIRRFVDKDPGNIMVPITNAGFGRVFGHLDDPPVKSFELGTDTNGAPWPEELEGRIVFGITEPISNPEELLADCGLAQPAWTGREYGLYVFGTYGRDFTAGGDALIIRDSFGITKAPERKDFGDLAARVLVVGEEGQHLWRENVGADTSRGILEVATSAGGIHDTDAMHRAARLLALEGEQPQEQLTREGVGKGPGPKPLRDFRCDDTLIVQRGNDTGERRVNRPCVELSVTRGPNGVRWHAKFSDRHEDRLARMIRRMNRLAQGTIPGPSGTAEPPGDDIRTPTAPTGVAVTVTPRGKSADQAISWAHDGLADDGVEINLRGFQVGERRSGGVIAMITEVDKTEFDWERLDVGIGARDLFVRAVSRHGFVSAWSADVDGEVIDDAPQMGPSLVLDAFHVNADIREQRKTDAGAGFDWVLASGRYEGELTSTSPVVKYGIGNKYGPTDGFVLVKPGEKFLVGGTHRRVGGSSATLRYRVRWFDAAGAGNNANIFTTAALGTTDATQTAVWTVPAGAVKAALQATAVTVVGGAAIRFHTPTFDRQASTDRVEDDAVISTKVASSAITNPKIASLAVDGPKIAVSAVSNTKIATDAVDGRTVIADAIDTVHIAANVDILGVITTGSGLTLGGISAQDVDFPSGAAIGDSGGGGLTFQGGDVSFPADVNIVGTMTDGLSARAFKTAIKPIPIEQAKRLLDVDAVTFKYRDAVLRERTKRVIPAREVTDRATGKKRKVAQRIIPGHVDKRRHAGLIADDLADAGFEEIISRDSDGALAGIQYAKLTPYLLRLIQDLYERVDEISGTGPTG